MSKKRKLLDIIRQLQDIYPHLDRLLITDVDDPDQIVLTSEEHLKTIASDEGFDIDEVDTFFDEDITEEELAGLIGLDDDDDNGGGMLQ